MTRTLLTPDVVVVGAGPAGLTAAAGLRAHGVPHVLVLEREGEAGGIPRHSDHTGYGLRDLRRVLRGPAYARLLTERRAGELMAEELRAAQRALEEITGAFTSEDLLGRIFSSFCIGK